MAQNRWSNSMAKMSQICVTACSKLRLNQSKSCESGLNGYLLAGNKWFLKGLKALIHQKLDPDHVPSWNKNHTESGFRRFPGGIHDQMIRFQAETSKLGSISIVRIPEIAWKRHYSKIVFLWVTLFLLTQQNFAFWTSAHSTSAQHPTETVQNQSEITRIG